MTAGSLFSGVEGFGLGAALANIPTIWSCEVDKYCQEIIRKNFGKKHLIYGDIKEVSHPPYVDIISGGFPCQDISIAGKGEGIKGAQSGLWSEYARIIREVRPKYVIIENSPMLLSRGFEKVLCDLSEIGYNAEWQCLSGTDFGIQQGRERLYCIAYPDKIRLQGMPKEPIFRKPYLSWESVRVAPGWRNRRDIPKPRTYRSANDFSGGLDRLKCIGNAVQPLIAYYLFQCIQEFDNFIK